MSHTVKFQETLRRLTMIDEGFVEGQAGLGFDLAGAAALDARTVALLRLGAAAAIGSPGICLEWSTGRALAAATTRLSPATGAMATSTSAISSSVAPAAPEVAIALGYDVVAALEEPDG